jgi:hypothetical protein
MVPEIILPETWSRQQSPEYPDILNTTEGILDRDYKCGLYKFGDDVLVAVYYGKEVGKCGAVFVPRTHMFIDGFYPESNVNQERLDEECCGFTFRNLESLGLQGKEQANHVLLVLRNHGVLPDTLEKISFMPASGVLSKPSRKP